jgi:glycosyltransferase involved in cell wall biosynthesis
VDGDDELPGHGDNLRTGPSRPRRVLHVSMPTVAGVPVVALGYVEDQVARGWSVSLACPSDGWLGPAAAAAGAHVLPWPARRDPGPSTAAETWRLARLVAAEMPDLVHLHSAKAGLAGRLAMRGHTPTVFQPHAWSFLAVADPMRRVTLAWERYAARWTDALVCVSEAERTVGRESGVRAAAWVVPNGVDCNAVLPAGRLDRVVARARLGLPDIPMAVCVGRLCRQKGQDLLLDAWELARGEVPTGARLVLIGEGPDRAHLQARIDEAHNVLLIGNRGDVADWLTAADVVVTSSRWEGMALVPIEAMAHARSVVATDVPGIRETVPAGAGAIVAVGDGGALARQIAVRLADVTSADAEGRLGRQHVEAHHDRARAAASIAELYASVLDRRWAARSTKRIRPGRAGMGFEACGA